MSKRYHYELELEYEWLINQYQIIFNSIIIERLGNPKGIDEVYKKMSGLGIGILNQLDYNKLLEDELLYKKLDFFDNYNKIISNILQDLNLDNGVLDTDKDKEYLFDYLIKNLYEKLKKKLVYYDKGQMLFILYALSSYIAEFSEKVHLVFDDKSTLEDNMPFNERERKILFTIKSICKDDISEVSRIFGTDKIIVQLLINILLYDNVESGSRSIEYLDYVEVYQITYSLIHLYSIKRAVTAKFSHENWVKVENNKLVLSNDLLNRMRNIVTKSSRRKIDERIDISSEVYINIFNEFRRIHKFSPLDLNTYLLSKDKMIMDDRYSHVVDIEILEQDIINITGISKEGVDNLIARFTLNDIPENQVINSIEDEDNRIFRSPIIMMDRFAIISYPLLHHAVRSFSYRITKKEFGTNRKMEKIIKHDIDETDLNTIKQLLEEKDIKYMLNDDIVHILFNNSKSNKISKEIDCAFIYDDTFYLIELKNKKLRFDIRGIVNERRSVRKDIKNMLDKITIIDKLENRGLFENYFGKKFISIKPLLVFTRYSPVLDIDFDNKGIDLLTVNELVKLLKGI